MCSFYRNKYQADFSRYRGEKVLKNLPSYHLIKIMACSWVFFWNPVCANRLNQSDFLIFPNLFPQLSTDPKKVVMWNVNWKINMIDGKWPWRRHFHNSSPPAWDAPDLCAACLLVSPRWVLYTIFVATAKILGDAYHKTDMVSLYPQVRRWSWWWEIMGNISSLMVIFIQIVYICYLWKYSLFDINFVHSDYLL